MVSIPTDSSLQHMSHTQGIGDLAQIAFAVRPILHHRGTADHLELNDLGQVVEDLVLDTVRKVGAVLIGAEAFEGKTGDALFGWRRKALQFFARKRSKLMLVHQLCSRALER